MRVCLILISLICSNLVNSQNIIEWNPNYEITIGDFKSPQTEINSKLNTYSLYTGADIQFSFHMSNAEFMFTKNFNSKVKCIFNRNNSILVAPDSITANHLISMAHFSYDLSELYARRLRKDLYENKGAFSSPGFFEPIFQKAITERNEHYVKVSKKTEMGTNSDLLKKEHDVVLLEIETLSEYCFDCKKPKKKKK